MDEEPTEVLRKWMQQGHSIVEGALKDRQIRLDIAAQERDSLEQTLQEVQSELTDVRNHMKSELDAREKQIDHLLTQNETLRQQCAASKSEATATDERCKGLYLQLQSAIEERDEAHKEKDTSKETSSIFLGALQRSLTAEESIRKGASEKYNKLHERCRLLTEALEEQKKRAERAEEQLHKQNLPPADTSHNFPRHRPRTRRQRAFSPSEHSNPYLLNISKSSSYTQSTTRESEQQNEQSDIPMKRRLRPIRKRVSYTYLIREGTDVVPSQAGSSKRPKVEPSYR